MFPGPSDSLPSPPQAPSTTPAPPTPPAPPAPPALPAAAAAAADGMPPPLLEHLSQLCASQAQELAQLQQELADTRHALERTVADSATLTATFNDTISSLSGQLAVAQRDRDRAVSQAQAAYDTSVQLRQLVTTLRGRAQSARTPPRLPLPRRQPAPRGSFRSPSEATGTGAVIVPRSPAVPVFGAASASPATTAIVALAAEDIAPTFAPTSTRHGASAPSRPAPPGTRPKPTSHRSRRLPHAAAQVTRSTPSVGKRGGGPRKVQPASAGKQSPPRRSKKRNP